MRSGSSPPQPENIEQKKKKNIMYEHGKSIITFKFQHHFVCTIWRGYNLHLKNDVVKTRRQAVHLSSLSHL